MQPTHGNIDADNLLETSGGNCQKIACAASDLQNLFRRNYLFKRAVVECFHRPFGSFFAQHGAANKLRTQIFGGYVAEAPIIFKQFLQLIPLQTGKNDLGSIMIFLKIEVRVGKHAEIWYASMKGVILFTDRTGKRSRQYVQVTAAQRADERKFPQRQQEIVRIFSILNGLQVKNEDQITSAENYYLRRRVQVVVTAGGRDFFAESAFVFEPIRIIFDPIAALVS